MVFIPLAVQFLHHSGVLAAVPLFVFLMSCDFGPHRTPQGYLFEKGPYQGFYGPSGRLMRLLYDENGDKRADIVMLFHANGKVSRAEIDSNRDGIVDRWQYFNEGGGLEKEGYARRRSDKPDLWQYFGRAGQVERRELDEDGDGQADRVEDLNGGRLVSVGIDGDRNGKMERWQTWVDGRVSREEVDVDGDSIADRRLKYDGRGNLVGVDVLRALASVGAPASRRIP